MSTHDHTLPVSVQLRFNTACDGFEGAWRAGQRPRIEDFLGKVPEAEQAALLGELTKRGSNCANWNNTGYFAGEWPEKAKGVQASPLNTPKEAGKRADLVGISLLTQKANSGCALGVKRPNRRCGLVAWLQRERQRANCGGCYSTVAANPAKKRSSPVFIWLSTPARFTLIPCLRHGAGGRCSIGSPKEKPQYDRDRVNGHGTS